MNSAALDSWLNASGGLLPLWRGVLWLVVAYLAGLGVSALGWPGRARLFLSGFARGWRNNLLEAILRGFAGLAFIAAASTTRAPEFSRLLGLFLVVTALAIAVLPGWHARFARPATRFIFAIFPLFGVVAIILAALTGWFIVRA